MKDIGLDNHIIQWIASYLLTRKQCVVVDGVSSDTSSVVSGAPQGSVLGPLLFITYVYSVNSLVLTKGTQITMYADEILLIKPISATDDYICLQRYITAIADCIDNLHLSINSSTCKYIIASGEKSSLISQQ